MPFGIRTAAIAVLCLLGGAGAAVPAAAATPQRQQGQQGQQGQPHGATAEPAVHDPVMIKCGQRYYLFCTGQGISVFVSDDMRSWRYDGAVFDTAPAWITRYVPRFKRHFWAPDILYHDGMYHLYYSCSTFGSNRSVIGHAVNATLDRNDPSYRWVDTGAVIASSPQGDDWNAIDPNAAIDADGVAWLCFGSFWSGIRLVCLDSGLDRTYESQRPCLLAARDRAESPENAIEAPFIFRHGGYYYLFVSVDFCCRGAQSTYRIAVGRSERITGPYTDRNGRPMEEGGMTLLTSSSERWAAIGHCGIHTVDGRDMLVAHAYDARDGRAVLIVRPIKWDSDGWPDIEP